MGIIKARQEKAPIDNITIHVTWGGGANKVINEREKRQGKSQDR